MEPEQAAERSSSSVAAVTRGAATGMKRLLLRAKTLWTSVFSDSLAYVFGFGIVTQIIIISAPATATVNRVLTCGCLVALVAAVTRFKVRLPHQMLWESLEKQIVEARVMSECEVSVDVKITGIRKVPEPNDKRATIH